MSPYRNAVFSRGSESSHLWVHVRAKSRTPAIAGAINPQEKIVVPGMVRAPRPYAGRSGMDLALPAQDVPGESNPARGGLTIDHPSQHRSGPDVHYDSNRGAADGRRVARRESGMRLGQPSVASGSVGSEIGRHRRDPSTSVALGDGSGAARCKPLHSPVAARGRQVKTRPFGKHHYLLVTKEPADGKT